MIVLPNMGLVKWDSFNDAFSHEQLAANFQALDTHDHTGGKGVKIPYGGLAEQSVGPENLREGAFGAAALANESIETPKIKNAAITPAKLSSSSLESFLQTASAATRKFNRGTVICKWTVEEFYSTEKEFTHGLGSAPTVVVLSPGPGISLGGCTIDVMAVTATNVKVKAHNTVKIAAGQEQVFGWIAIT